jgi:hypothetical protein
MGGEEPLEAEIAVILDASSLDARNLYVATGKNLAMTYVEP